MAPAHLPPRDHHHHGHHQHGTPSLNRTAFMATLHCLSGCAVGEVLGMVIGTALGLGTIATIALAVTLAFLFGYAFTMWPLLRAGIAPKRAAALAFASDTASIALMETIDNAIMAVWPGAMDAGLGSPVFWIALATSLVLAGLAAYPLNRALIARGKGHAVVHAHHGGHGHQL